MILREMILDEDIDGVQAISLVTDPAIMKNFVHFSEQVQLRTIDIGNGYYVDLDEFWKYTTGGANEEIDTSHEFCKSHCVGGSLNKGNPLGTWHISEINGWNSFNLSSPGFIKESNFFGTFQGVNNSSYNIDNQLYNCRHHFARVRRLSEVSAGNQLKYRKKYSFNINQTKEQKIIQFKVNKEKREIAGPALIPNLMIYRNEIGGTGQDGYVWLSRKTIKQIKDQYGYNRTLTIQHESDITGRAILLDSWIYPDEKEETFGVEVPEGTWFLKYKIIDDKLWQVIKDRNILGFSIEGMFNLREPKN